MSKQLVISLPDADVEAFKHIEPSRLIDAAIASVQFRLNVLNDDPNPDYVEEEIRRYESVLAGLRAVRNPWILLIGTARLQCLGGDTVHTTGLL